MSGEDKPQGQAAGTATKAAPSAPPGPPNPRSGPGPMGNMGMPVQKPMDFKGSLRRFAGSLRPERLNVVILMVLGIGSVALTVLGPKLLGDATNVIFAGFVGARLPEGGTTEPGDRGAPGPGPGPDGRSAVRRAGRRARSGHRLHGAGADPRLGGRGVPRGVPVRLVAGAHHHRRRAAHHAGPARPGGGEAPPDPAVLRGRQAARRDPVARHQRHRQRGPDDARRPSRSW